MGVPHISQFWRDGWLRNVHAGHAMGSCELERVGLGMAMAEADKEDVILPE